MEYGRKIYTQYGWMPEKKQMTELEKVVSLIAEELESPDPHRSLKFAAMYWIAEYDRRRLPDWIEALANGNIHNWNAVVDEVRRLKKAEELEDDNDDDV